VIATTIPGQGLCAVCEQTVSIRLDGTTYAHPIPPDVNAPLVGTLTADGIVWIDDCAGGNRPPALLLEMTFARWLHAHAGRRDTRTNPVAWLAKRCFRPCPRTVRTPADVPWTGSDELHLLLHGTADTCNQACRILALAAAAYDRDNNTHHAA
jgi:hypothetical protein